MILHKHVITCDRSIIDNKEIRNIKKGLHYRRKQPFNKAMTTRSINEVIGHFIATISESSVIQANVFYEPYSDQLKACYGHPAKQVFLNGI